MSLCPLCQLLYIDPIDSKDKNFKIYLPIWAPTKTFWMAAIIEFLRYLIVLIAAWFLWFLSAFRTQCDKCDL